MIEAREAVAGGPTLVEQPVAMVAVRLQTVVAGVNAIPPSDAIAELLPDGTVLWSWAAKGVVAEGRSQLSRAERRVAVQHDHRRFVAARRSALQLLEDLA